MRVAFIKKQLNSGINAINIPTSKQILPAAAFIKEYPKNKNISRIYFKKFATAAAALVVVVSVILGVNSINFNGVTPTPQPVDTRPVIYGEDNINISPLWVDGSSEVGTDSEGERISDKLREKMDEYAGQDVLFGVYVDFPLNKKYSDGFTPSDQITQKKQALLEQMKILSAEIEEIEEVAYPPKSYLSNEEIEELRNMYSEFVKERSSLHDQYAKWSELENLERRKYVNFNWKKELEYAKQIVGAVNMSKKFSGHSEFYFNLFTDAYIMKLTADMINALAERGTCKIYLALPERQSGYSIKISDTLTYYLERMNETDTLEVAVVTTADASNDYAYNQGLTKKRYYNSHLTSAFPGVDMAGDGKIDGAADYSYAARKAYVNAIVERNGLTEKRIFVEDAKDYDLGFNAKLTKAEILALVNDNDIKVIYYAENTVNPDMPEISDWENG